MKLILTITAYLMLLIGLVSMVSPIPGGTFLIAGGCAILICTNERTAGKIRNVRGNKPWVNTSMIWIEDKMGPRLSGPMRTTRPIAQESLVED